MKQISELTIVLISMLIVFFLGLCCIDAGHNWGDDFAMYIEQCQAIANGTYTALIEANRFTIDNSYGHLGPYFYPNGLPILLLPIYWTLGLNLWAMKIFCWILFVLSLPFLYRLLKAQERFPKQALFITLFIGFNYHFIRFGDHVMSDLPFFAFSILTIWLIHQYKQASIGKGIMIGFLIFFSYNIRDAGVFLLLYWLVYCYNNRATLSKSKWHYLPYAVFILSYILYKSIHPAVPNFSWQLLSTVTLESIGNNILFYLLLWGNYFAIFRICPTSIQWIISTVVAAILLLGLTKIKKQEFPFFFYLGINLGLCIIWVSFQGMRFVFPMLPFALFFLSNGLYYLVKDKFIVPSHLILLGAFILQSLVATYHYWKTDTNEVYTEDMQSMYKFIKEKTPTNSIIIFIKPRAIRLFTNRNAVQKPISTAQYKIIPTAELEDDNYLFKTNSYTLIEL